MATDGQEPRLETNRLLAALPDDARGRLAEQLELVELQLREPVLKQGEPIGHVYFPADAVASLLSELEDGRPVEIATVGREGMVGLPVFLNTSSTSAYMGFIQVSGRLWRMPVDDFRNRLDDSSELHDVLQRYTQGLFGQLAINVACNQAHSVERRLARWLLMTRDRVGQDDFGLTQEFAAQMLGVRRATVNQTAQALQERGLIRYTRGRLSIVDRERLEAVSCDCYRRINEEFDRLFPPDGAKNVSSSE